MQTYGPPCGITIPLQILYLYDKAVPSEGLMKSGIGKWCITIVGAGRGWLLSSTLFNIYLEINISDALEEHDSIGGSTITNLRFANDIKL